MSAAARCTGVDNASPNIGLHNRSAPLALEAAGNGGGVSGVQHDP